jgi:hypothetical protein
MAYSSALITYRGSNGNDANTNEDLSIQIVVDRLLSSEVRFWS